MCFQKSDPIHEKSRTSIDGASAEAYPDPDEVSDGRGAWREHVADVVSATAGLSHGGRSTMTSGENGAEQEAYKYREASRTLALHISILRFFPLPPRTLGGDKLQKAVFTTAKPAFQR